MAGRMWSLACVSVAACAGGGLTTLPLIPGGGAVMGTGVDGDAPLALVPNVDADQVWRWDGSTWVGLIDDVGPDDQLAGPFVTQRGTVLIFVRRYDATLGVESYELRWFKDGVETRSAPVPLSSPLTELSDGTVLLAAGDEVWSLPPDSDTVALFSTDRNLALGGPVALGDDRLLTLRDDGIWVFGADGNGTLAVPCGALGLCEAPSPGLGLVGDEPTLVLGGGTFSSELTVAHIDVDGGTLTSVGTIPIEVPGEADITATPAALALGDDDDWVGVFVDSYSAGAEGFLVRGKVGGRARLVTDGLFGVSGLRMGTRHVWAFAPGERRVLSLAR